MGKVTRLFCWHQHFVHKRLSAPAPGLYTFGKTLKNVYKIRIQRDLFETCNIWAKGKGLSVVIKICPQGVVWPCPGAIYMYKSIKIYTRTRCQVSVYRTIGPLVYQYIQITVTSLFLGWFWNTLHQNKWLAKLILRSLWRILVLMFFKQL